MRMAAMWTAAMWTAAMWTAAVRTAAMWTAAAVRMGRGGGAERENQWSLT
jgi:hypothetical protein